ncbi:MAG: TonB-dependent receptor plug domain-containing protein, partial [Lentisphaeraceae bacterium]|nr:TonB-dependent receptor plug domain-containing protein [Lentisphaeraceae bacterium]
MHIKQILLFWFFPLALLAQKNDASDIYAMSFEELANIELTLASKVEETIFEAPSSITVFTRSEIINLGITDIYSLLNHVPGFQVTRESSFALAPTLHVRGTRDKDDFILFMLNGQRLNEISIGSAQVYNRYLNLDNVKQVEIIRGPGAALYGNNAVLAIVNIVTSNELNSIKLSSGSHQNKEFSFNFNQQIFEDLKLNLFVHKRKHDGSVLKVADGRSTRDPQDDWQVFGQLSWQAWQLEAFYTQNKRDDSIQFANIAENSTFNESQSAFFRLKHKFHWPESELSWENTFSYAYQTLDMVALIIPAGVAGSYDFFAGPLSRSEDYKFTSDLQWDISEFDHLLLGFNYRRTGLDYSGAYSSHIAPDLSELGPPDSFFTGGIHKFYKIGSFKLLHQFLDIYGAYTQYKKEFTQTIAGHAG